MTKEESFAQLLNTVQNDVRHADYKRVTELAEDYKILITGKGIEKKLKRFNPREDEVMFQQRVRLTISITPAVISSIKKPFNKVPRTQPVTRKVVAKKDSDNTAVTEIQERMAAFYGGENNVGGIDFYLQNRFTNLSFSDPNAWIVIEFDPFDSNTEKPTPRPFEVSAHNAINFSIKNNNVEWLVVQSDIQYEENEGGKIIKKAGKKYTIYAENDAWTFTETSPDNSKRVLQTPGEELKEIEGKGTFIIRHYETLTARVPALRVGYITDEETDGRTFVSPFHDSLCYFEKSIKLVSEFDLSTCLHTFPQKVIRITKGCKGENGETCDRGRLPSGEICGACKGTGKPLHTSGQDVIEVEMVGADDPEYVALTDFVHYVELPVELLRLQKEWVDELKQDCHQTVFNSTALLRATGPQVNPIAKTATEQKDNMESVYDTLQPFAEKVSSVWTTFVEFIAILTDNRDKVTIIHRFPSNFKLKTRFDLYNEHKALKDSGAPAFVVDAIDDELAEDIYADDAEALLKYLVKKEHYPFVGKTGDEIVLLLASPFVLKKTKILYSYFDEIFTELEREYKKSNKDFYLEKVDVRTQRIEEKIKRLQDQLDQENQTAFSFKANNIPSPILQ